MKKRQLAIVFDNYSVRFIEAKIKKNRIKTIYNTYNIENRDLIKDGVFDKVEWKKIFSEVLDKKIFKAKTAHLIIPTSLVILRQQAMPDLPVEQLKQVIQNEIGNTIFFPFDNPIFDIVKIESEELITTDDGAALCQSIIIATPSAIINDIIEVMIDRKHKILSIDIPALSLFRYFRRYFSEIDYETKILCYITNDGIDLHIFDKDILYFTRHVNNDIQLYNTKDNEFNDKEFATNFAYEVERARNYFNFTLDNRDKQINGVIISSEIEITNIFVDTLKEKIDFDISVIGNIDKSLPRKVRQFKGFELGIGAFIREVKK